MKPEEIRRFMNLRVAEQTGEGESGPAPFRASLRRPWHQHAGEREGADVEPGASLYVAVISDAFGMTYKVGSGQAKQRLAEMNRYRRPSQGEVIWSGLFGHEFRSPEAARAAEDHILAQAHREGFLSPDHNEFLVGIDFRRLKELFNEAVEIGFRRDQSIMDETTGELGSA